VTVIQEVYNVTMFIRGLVDDIKAMEAVKKEIQDKLEHELFFLLAFKDLFFDKDDAPMRSDRIHGYLKRDVNIILMSLKRTLAEYETVAAKHGLLSQDVSPNLENQVQISSSFNTRVKTKVKDIKRTLDWALFDKEKILKTLAVYSEWTGRLQQTMSLMLLVLASFGRFPLQDSEKSGRAKEIGLADVVKRQRLGKSNPPDEFGVLRGHIVEGSEVLYGSSTKVAKYEDEWCRIGEVLVEYRKYSSELVRASQFKLPDLEQLKVPVRSLAWLLHEASFTESQDGNPLSGQLAIYTFQCLGYIDQPENQRTILLYQLPKSTTPQATNKIITLHDWISVTELGGDPGTVLPKPSLGSRFFLAYALCLTVLNIHSSGWVHKNIWSHGIVMFPSSRPSNTASRNFIPYLTGWDSSRLIAAGTDLVADTKVEPNYYRHPIRQGYPQSPFKVEHDIYALGVVLLEIGLWKTVRSIFKSQIDKATTQGKLPPPELIKGELLEQARDGLPSEMGDLFAKAVERCLTSSFEVGDEAETVGITTSFREHVLDTVTQGLKL